MIKQVCRICATETYSYYLFRENGITTMIQALIPKGYLSRISTDILCVSCLLRLKSCYKFQQQVLQSSISFPSQPKGNLNINSTVETDIPDQDVKIELEETTCDMNTEEMCRICGKTTPKNRFNRHLSEHFNAAQECNICPNRFRNVKELRSHLQLEHDNKSPLLGCLNCGLSFKYQSIYDLHVTNVCYLRTTLEADEEEQSDLNIEQANSDIVEIIQIKTDFSEESDEEMIESNMCHLCGLSFKFLQSHLNSVHNPKTYLCEFCPRTFREFRRLERHVLRIHKNIKQFKCKDCSSEFHQKYDLMRHIGTRHLKLRPHICTYCKKGFSSKYALNTHVRKHTNELPFGCEVCGRGFTVKISLKNHLKSKHGIVDALTYHCKECGKGFPSPLSLNAHMKVH